MPYYSTLGYEKNPLLELYKKQFLTKLQQLWKNQVGPDIPTDDFLLYPDVHSLLLACSRVIDEKKEYIHILAKKWLEYKNE